MTLGGDSAVEKLLRQSAVASLQTGLEQGEPVAMHFSGNLLTLIPLAQQRERRSGWAMVVFDDTEHRLQVQGQCGWTTKPLSDVAVLLALRRSMYNRKPQFKNVEEVSCGLLVPTQLAITHR